MLKKANIVMYPDDSSIYTSALTNKKTRHYYKQGIKNSGRMG